jgi:hypothetical protein
MGCPTARYKETDCRPGQINGLVYRANPQKRFFSNYTLTDGYISQDGLWLFSQREYKLGVPRLASDCEKIDEVKILAADARNQSSACGLYGIALGFGYDVGMNEKRGLELIQAECAWKRPTPSSSRTQEGEVAVVYSATPESLDERYFKKEYGVKRSCHALGVWMIEGKPGLPKDSQKGFDIIRQYCEAGQSYACTSSVGFALSEKGLVVPPGYIRKAAFRGCAEGEGRSCAFLFGNDVDGNPIAIPDKDKLPLAMRGCTTTMAPSAAPLCGMIARQLAARQQYVEAHIFALRACNQDKKTLCEQLLLD